MLTNMTLNTTLAVSVDRARGFLTSCQLAMGQSCLDHRLMHKKLTMVNTTCPGLY